MKTSFNLAAVLGLLAACVAPLSAAERMVPEEGALEVMLLREKSVREDLKLSHSEADRIHRHCDAQWRKVQEASQLPEAERDKKFEEMTKENDRFLDKTLKKDQRKRLQQIELQVAGLLCVDRPHIAAKLKLTDEQKTRADELQKEARDEMEELIHADPSEQKQEKLDELRATSRKRLLELLTDEQEKIWKELVGAPFQGKFQFAAN